MTEESLKVLPINDLFDLLTKNMTDLSVLHKTPRRNKLAIIAKQKEVELIQKIILAKRSEFRPGHSM